MINFEKICKRRTELGISQKELAEEAMVNQSMIAYIERGAKQPSVALLVRIAHVLKCKPEDLYTVKGEN